MKYLLIQTPDETDISNDLDIGVIHVIGEVHEVIETWSLDQLEMYFHRLKEREIEEQVEKEANIVDSPKEMYGIDK